LLIKTWELINILISKRLKQSKIYFFLFKFVNKFFDRKNYRILNSKAIDEVENAIEIRGSKKDFTEIDKLKIKLNENFRDEIEKIFYDPKFNINIRPDTREINLLEMLKQKINKLNSLDWINL